MKQPEGSVTFILPEAMRILAKKSLAEAPTDASAMLPPGGQPLSAEDFCVFSTETLRPFLYPHPPAFYFAFGSSARAAGVLPAQVMTYRGIALGDEADLIFAWYRGIACTISTRQAADGFLRSVPDVAHHRDSLLVIGQYTLRFALWYVNDVPVTPRDFWASIEAKRISQHDVVDYCELCFDVQAGRVHEIEAVCHFATTVHLWPLGA